MDDVRERIYEVVGTLKSSRSRDAAAAILEAVLEIATAENGRVLISFRAEPRSQWSFGPEDAGAPRRVAKGEQLGTTPILIDASVDAERFEGALGKVTSVQQLAYQSGMRITGSSDFIVAASRAINRRCFPRSADRPPA